MASIKVIVTADGSHSLLNEDLNETYHSVHGAIQESVHVFIQNGFDHFVSQQNPEQFSILEIGFGTGLNALLTIQKIVEKPIRVHYTSLEAYPLGEEIWSTLNYCEELALKPEYKRLHQSAWDIEHLILPQFTLLKKHTTLQQVSFNPASYNLIYFDAFAPNKQPELWSIDMLQKVVEAMSESSVFVTYCAKGQLKRDLRALGLQIETLAGPPGKHEMVRATKVKV